jgi:N6-adenosine-specific RNA methylase IME4
VTDETALLVPDPRVSPVPAGWWDSHVRPTIAACESWTQLNEYEGQLQAMASLIESLGGDGLEFQKALRVVEARRGELLGPARPGKRTDLEPVPRVEQVDEVPLPKAAKTRYRQLAQHWETTLYPYLVHETDRRKVSQAHLLQLVHREANQRKLEALTAQKMAPTFDRLYDVVVIDPPWPMEKQERTKRPAQSRFDYPTMSEDDLMAFQVPARANCHIWLWTTQRFLPVAFRVLSAWTLKYVCTFVWHKPGGFQAIGLPQYNCEFALYARRGTPRFTTTKALPTCFTAPRGKHSEKPEVFYRLVRRVTNGHRIDIFNRRAIVGFRGWGNEAPCERR